MSANRLVVCPYDEAHKVKESRIQLHIVKCRENHKNEDGKVPKTFVCQFNATHVYPELEKSYHLSRCPDRAVLDRLMAAPLNQNNPFKGRTAVPSYSEPVLVESDEVWEVEEWGEATPGYVPTKETPIGGIVQPKPLSKPASRRQLYKDLHQMPTHLDKRPDDSTTPPAPRQPKQPSLAEKSFEEQGANLQNLGLGRGKQPVSRIAANIFSQQPEVSRSRQARGNYSSVITGMKNLGIGRGTADGANQSFLNDEDFPVLGVGRGIPKNSERQNN